MENTEVSYLNIMHYNIYIYCLFFGTCFKEAYDIHRIVDAVGYHRGWGSGLNVARKLYDPKFQNRNSSSE